MVSSSCDMIDFVGIPPLLSCITSCHDNHAFSHSPNRFMFSKHRFLLLGGSRKQFGTH